MKNIIGISCFYHDSAACLLQDGEIKCCVQEERFTRKKHDPSFPTNSIKYILDHYNITLDQIDKIIFYEKPILKFERLLETYLAFAPRGFKSFALSMPLWIKEKLFQKHKILSELKSIDINFSAEKILFSEHHISHAASCFYPSKFNEAIILTLDGVGEWSTTTYGYGKNFDIKIFKDIKFPHSLGLLYSAFTYYLGFKVNSGEYKVMGLAPYGKPIYSNKIFEKLIDVKEDGSFRMNMKYFGYATDLTMTNKHFNKLFGMPRRTPEDKLSQFHMDIAASVQQVIEVIVEKIVSHLTKKFNCKKICLAGGVALNCVANGKLIKKKIVDDIWIQPASGDAGGALGAALAYWHLELKNPLNKVSGEDSMQGAYLGPSYDEDEIKQILNNLGANYMFLEESKIFLETANHLKHNKIVGWFQGRMEYGPRSLGNRSILANPQSEEMQKSLNLKIKFRESFRPFAPAVLEEDQQKYFSLKVKSPYMLLVSNINEELKIKIPSEYERLFGIERLNIPKSTIPAVTHVDYSARLQTVSKETNLKFYKLIKKFRELTGCSVLINTSFNIRGEPIVCSVEDAFKCFMGTNLDVLVIGNYILMKENQDQNLEVDYRESFELD